MQELKEKIREVPDFPKPGILFYDVTTLLKDPAGLDRIIGLLAERYSDAGVAQVVGIESRGFIFAPALATRIGAGFVPVRKPGKLPAETISHSYDLEYGSDTLEIHSDAIGEGEKIVIVDDLIATGGTAQATGELVRRLGGDILEFAFLVELKFLNGRAKLPDHDVYSILQY